MIIELFGLPGSGKTTFAQNQDKNKFIFIKKSNYSFSKKSVVIFKYPTLLYWVKEIIEESLKNKKFLLIRFKLSLVIETFSIYDFAKKIEEQTEKDILIDEGFFQRLLSIYETKKSVEFLCKIIKNIRTDKIIITESRFDKFKRYKSTDNPRTKMGKKYLSNWAEVVEYNYSQIIKIVKDSKVSYEIINIGNK